MKGYCGYKKLKDDKDFIYEYNKLVELDIIKNIPIGLSGFIYIQLSDVEDEINGFITYDRQHIKIDVNKIKQINYIVACTYMVTIHKSAIFVKISIKVFY